MQGLGNTSPGHLQQKHAIGIVDRVLPHPQPDVSNIERAPVLLPLFKFPAFLLLFKSFLIYTSDTRRSNVRAAHTTSTDLKCSRQTGNTSAFVSAE